ncbi:MAG: copper ion binding protein [Clostridiales bacterium]|nr:copper ion binding protein [Clostridiales bacterium]
MKQNFTVTGMDCEHCVASVEKSVKELTGILHVVVSLEEESMVVDYDESIANAQLIIDAVVEAGFEAQAAV